MSRITFLNCLILKQSHKTIFQYLNMTKKTDNQSYKFLL